MPPPPIYPPALCVFFAAIFGAMMGSFANMFIYRLPRGIPLIARSRSFCPSCQHQLAWFDNLPILSYLMLLGRCRYCQKPIGARYLIVEVIVAGLYAAAAYQFFGLNHALNWAVVSGTFPVAPILLGAQFFLILDLAVLAAVDFEKTLIPPETTLPWMLAGLLLAPIFPDLHPSATSWTSSLRANAFLDSFTGLVIGAGLLWAINILTTAVSFAWFRLIGRADRPLEGMGIGDAHLMGMVGALLGWKPVLCTFAIGLVIGLAMGLGKIVWTWFWRWRLGGKYTPWQPTFDLPPPASGPPSLLSQLISCEPPHFWPLAVRGLIVLAAVWLLYQQSMGTFNPVTAAMIQTDEERKQAGALALFFQQPQSFDVRLIPVWIMLFISALLMLAFPFLKYLAASNSLPQGEIVEGAGGEKQEVLKEYNYMPFGPALAMGAIITVFYDPLIRMFLFWGFALGGQGPLPPLPHRVIGQSAITPVLAAFVQLLGNPIFVIVVMCVLLFILALMLLRLFRSRGGGEGEAAVKSSGTAAKT